MAEKGFMSTSLNKSLNWKKEETFLIASNVVRAVLRIAQLLLLFFLISTFLINDAIPLFTMHMMHV